MPTTPMKNNLYRLGLILFAPSVATQQVLFRYREDETLPLSPDYGPGRLFKRHHMMGGTLVLDDGKIADMGTHDELMERSEIYREVYTSQQKGVE